MNEVEKRANALRKAPFQITCKDCKWVVNIHEANEFRNMKLCLQCKSPNLQKDHRVIASL